MTIDLPDGALARIEYKGDVAPKLTVGAVRGGEIADPAMTAPFALFDRIAADMDRQMDAMFRQARMRETAAAGDTPLDRTTFSALPTGTVSYRFVSTSTGNGVCSRSVQVTSLRAGQQPKVTRNGSGGRHARAAGSAHKHHLIRRPRGL